MSVVDRQILEELILIKWSLIGIFVALLEKAEEMARMYPGDAFAIWYSAIGHHKAGQLGAALSCLAELKRVSPAWSTDAGDRFRAEIQSEMDGPRPHNA